MTDKKVEHVGYVIDLGIGIIFCNDYEADLDRPVWYSEALLTSKTILTSIYNMHLFLNDIREVFIQNDENLNKLTRSLLVSYVEKLIY